MLNSWFCAVSNQGPLLKGQGMAEALELSQFAPFVVNIRLFLCKRWKLITASDRLWCGGLTGLRCDNVSAVYTKPKRSGV